MQPFQKPYACQVAGCSKRYTDPSSLRKHVKNHSGRDPAHAQARRAGSTGDGEGSTGSGTVPDKSSHRADLTRGDHQLTCLCLPAESQFAALTVLAPRADSGAVQRLDERCKWAETGGAGADQVRDGLATGELTCSKCPTDGDISLDDAMFPSADDIDQAIREFIPFDEVGKLFSGSSGEFMFVLHIVRASLMH